MKIKVLHLVTSNQIYGTEKVVLQLMKYYNKDIFDFKIGLPSIGNFSEHLEKLNLNYFIYNNKILNRYSLNGLSNLYNYIKVYKPEIIHSHTSFLPGIIGSLANVSVKIETRHGIHFSDYELENLSLFKKLKEKYKYLFLSHITTVSKSDKLKLINKFNYPENKISVVYNSFDDKIKTHLNIKNKDWNFNIGTVGRLVPEKNQKLIIDIFSELLKHFPNLKLTIVGDGQEKKNIKNYIEKLHLLKKVKILDYTDNVHAIMKSFDVFILTSKYEGIPLTIMDALALGIPVVASNVGSISEIVKNGFNGFTLELNNINGFVETIINIINNRNLYETLSSNAIYSVQNFTVEKMVKEYENLYLRLLNKS